MRTWTGRLDSANPRGRRLFRRAWLGTWLAAALWLSAWGPGAAAQQPQPPALQVPTQNSAANQAAAEDQPKSYPPSAATADDKGATSTGKAAPTRRPTFDKQSAEILESLKSITGNVDQVTVGISHSGRPVALGTIVDSGGFVLTKASELKGALTCKLSDGRTFPAQVFGIHEKTDLALLKIDATELPTAEWSSAEPPPVGYWVVTPKIESPPLLGIVSVKPRAILPATGYVGVEMAPHADGVRIVKVFANSPAENAGLQVNDVIVEFNGQKVTDQDSLRAMIQKNPVGTEVRLKILRGGQPLEFQLQLTDQSIFGWGSDRSEIQNEMGGRLSRRRLDFPMALQHDTPLAPSECGGPIIDLSGKVVGVNIARSGRVDSLALPAAVVASVIEMLKSGQLAPAVIHKAEIEKIQARLAEISREMEQVPQQKIELNDTLNRNAARLEEMRKVLEDVQARVTELEAEHAEAASKLSTANASSSKLQKEKERLEDQLRKLESGTN